MKTPGRRARLAAIAACACLFASPVHFASPSGAAPRGLEVKEFPHVDAPPFVDGRVIVRYRDETAKAPAARAAVRASVGATIRREYTIFPGEALDLAPGTSVQDAVRALRADPSVLYAEPDYVVSAHSLPNDRYFNEEWGLDNTGQIIDNNQSPGAGIDVDAPEAWQYGTGTPEVVVAMLDEGLDVTHPDIAPNAWLNPREIPANGIDDDQNGFIDDIHGWDFLNDDDTVFDGAQDDSNSIDFHGTHTGGTVGAAGNNEIGVAGVCWSVKLMSVKFLARQGTTDDAIAGMQYILGMKRAGVNVRAINASWGGGDFSNALLDSIRAAGDEDILFVASAGNGGSDDVGDNNDALPQYPSSYDAPNVISVGAWTRYDQRASFSNFGAGSVDIFAPGALVASTGPNGSYYYSNGTSMAAPHVTGAAALMASIAPTITAAQIKEAILQTARPATGCICASGGRLDLRAAVIAAIEKAGGSTGGGGDPDPPPQPDPPVLNTAKYLASKKTVVVTGANLKLDTTVIELDGTAMPVVRYLDKYRLPDGTFVGLEGKAPGRINFFIPKNRSVQVTVYDTETQLRSAPVSIRR